MHTTTHTGVTGEGSAYRVNVNHEDYIAVQYEFYIPEAIWDLTSVQTLIERLESVTGGATIFGGVTGVWKGDKESIRIYRWIVATRKLTPDNMRPALQHEIGRLMGELSKSAMHNQEAFMFTETQVQISMSNSVTQV